MAEFLKRTCTLLSIAALFIPIADADEAGQLGDRLLGALGGADAWREAAAVHNTAVNHHPQARLPYIQEYWYFTETPRHVVKINNHDMQRMRSYTQTGGWSLVEGEVRPFSDERLANELSSWNRSLYRKLYLLASDSPDLSLSLGDDGSLEFYESGQFAGWITIASDGAPLRHGGSRDRNVYTDFDELVTFGQVRWPSAGQDETGWRFEMLSIELLEEEPEISTEPPVD